MLKKTETKLWLTATNATQSNDLTARRDSMSSHSWHRLSGRPPLPTGNLKLALLKTLVWYLRIKWSIHEHGTKKKRRCISSDLSMFHWTYRSSSFRVEIGCNFLEINNMLQFVEPINSREGNADYSPLSGFRIFSNAWEVSNTWYFGYKKSFKIVLRGNDAKKSFCVC